MKVAEQVALTWQEEVRSRLRSWLRGRKRKTEGLATQTSSRRINAKLASASRQADKALDALRSAVDTLIQHPPDHRAARRQLDAVARSFKPWQRWYQVPADQPRPAHRPPGDRWLRDTCRDVMARHGVTAAAVAEEVVTQAERLPRDAKVVADLVGNGDHDERVKRFADRLRRARK